MSWPRMGFQTESPLPRRTSKLEALKAEHTSGRRPTPLGRSYRRDQDAIEARPIPQPQGFAYYASVKTRDVHSKVAVPQQHGHGCEEHNARSPALQEALASLARVGELVQAPVGVVQAARDHVITALTLADALSVPLSAPWVGGTDGSLGLDWTHSGRRLAITFTADGTIEFYASSGSLERDGNITARSEQAPWMLWLLGVSTVTTSESP